MDPKVVRDMQDRISKLYFEHLDAKKELVKYLAMTEPSMLMVDERQLKFRMREMERN